MDTQSLWRGIQPPRFSPLLESRRFDVVVVGGGIAGLTAAYLLKRSGRTVCLLERDRLGSGDTGSTSAHLTYVTDLPLTDLVKNFGRDEARLAWQGGEVAIALIESIVERESIACGFRRIPGHFHAPLTQDVAKQDWLQETAQLANELGFDAAYSASPMHLPKPAVAFPDQARFHPLQYLAGLAEAVEGEGSLVCEGANADEIIAEPLGVRVGDRTVRCEFVVLATHVPMMGRAGWLSSTMLQTKLYPYTSYVVSADAAAGAFPEGLFWDTEDPYHYLRVDAGAERDRLIFGGEDHKTGQAGDTRERFGRLERSLRSYVPAAHVTKRWSGQVVETNDGLPYIGETARRQFSATGFGGNGMTFGTLAGLMACDAALGRENPWQELFAMERKQLRGGLWDYLRENADYPWQLLKGWASRRPQAAPSLSSGGGRIVGTATRPIACARDEHGHEHRLSAVCTHLGCIVAWNAAERTWDCPCHGSRFKVDGTLLAGPAEQGLTPLDAESARVG